MPTTRRRRARNLAPGLSPFQKAWLLDADLPERDDEAIGWYFFEKHLDNLPQSAAGLWRAHESELLIEFIVTQPGARPRIWWRTRAPELRRRLGGTGTPIGRDLDCGMPAHWQGIDPRDPPRFESQAAYLRRLGLLLPGEVKRLKPAAFETERVLPELDDVPASGHAH